MARHPTKDDLLSQPTRPFTVGDDASAASVLERMQGTAFQGRQLGQAFQAWKAMLGDRCSILMGDRKSVV